MGNQLDSTVGHQQTVNGYFQGESTFWKKIYEEGDVYSLIHRDRRTAALRWIDELGLPSGARAIDIGCGAGSLSVALAQRGLEVCAIDSTPAMVTLTGQAVQEAGVAERVSVGTGDVHALEYPDESFDLVVALGVLPWIAGPDLALREMARIVKPDGYVLFSADNSMRMNALLDPWINPLTIPIKRGIKASLVRAGLYHLTNKDVGATTHSRHEVDGFLAHAGLETRRAMTLGFGPFTLFRRSIIPQAAGVRLHRRLQGAADRGMAVMRSTGGHHLILSAKPHISATTNSDAPAREAAQY